MRRHRLAILAVVAAILAASAFSAAWTVSAARHAMIGQVQASERMAAADRTQGLANALAPLGSGVTIEPILQRHDGHVVVRGVSNGETVAELSPDLLLPLPALQATTSLLTRDGRVLVSNSPVTAPRATSPEILRLLAAGRSGAATYHSAVLDRDRIGVVAPVPGTDLMVVIGADAAFANRPATALAHRLIAAFLVMMVVVGALAALLLLLVQRSRRRLRSERDRAEAMARTDVLTGLANRRAFDEVVADLAAGDRRVGVVAIDLDGLKQLNDELGHDAGDEALRLVAAAMRASIRPGDVLARLGGDEFTVLLTGSSAEDAAVVAARMETAVAAIHVDGHGHLAISTGVSGGPGARVVDALWEADVEMYRAKRERKARSAAEV